MSSNNLEMASERAAENTHTLYLDFYRKVDNNDREYIQDLIFELFGNNNEFKVDEGDSDTSLKVILDNPFQLKRLARTFDTRKRRDMAKRALNDESETHFKHILAGETVEEPSPGIRKMASEEQKRAFFLKGMNWMKAQDEKKTNRYK